jgi:tripartite-type tricarboxylate transporter receptor subunit TctC
MRTSLGQTVIIENVSGAGGSIGVGRVARAAPDGYTVSIGHWQTHVLNGAAYQLPYDVVKDFESVSLLAAAPDVPTIDEAGASGLYASFWHGLWLPKGTPKEIIVKLNASVQAALADATVRKRFADQGQDIPPPEQQTPEALAAQQKAEIEKWWPIIKAGNVKGE